MILKTWATSGGKYKIVMTRIKNPVMNGHLFQGHYYRAIWTTNGKETGRSTRNTLEGIMDQVKRDVEFASHMDGIRYQLQE